MRESHESDLSRTLLTFALGAAGGLAVGLLLSSRGGRQTARELGGDLRTRVGRAAARVTPARLARTVTEEAELTRLEDAVLDALLDHPVLRERPIDVGAVSRGIVELSGAVWTDDEALTAVRLANGVDGVQTVVNRLEIEAEARHFEENRRRFEDGDPALTETRWEGRIVGMGRMRQGPHTEPKRPDDSQRQRERALEKADRDDWQSEDLAAGRPRVGERPEAGSPGAEPSFSPDELDHQDPHRAGHAPETLDQRPQELRSRRRVGEGLKPGTELDLEEADVPLKPHRDI